MGFSTPSPLLFQESSRAASRELSGTTEQLLGPGRPPRSLPQPRAPERRAFGFRKLSPHSPLASTSAPRPTAEATDGTAACGNSARVASHLARHKKNQEVPRRAPSAHPTRRGPTPRTKPQGKPSTPLPDASPLFFLNYGFTGIINQRLVSYDYDTV